MLEHLHIAVLFKEVANAPTNDFLDSIGVDKAIPGGNANFTKYISNWLDNGVYFY